MPDEHRGEPAGNRPPVDLRRHRQVTERNLVIAGFAALLLVGGALVWWQYGLGAAATSWVCIAGGVVLFLLPLLFLKLAEIWLARREGR